MSNIHTALRLLKHLGIDGTRRPISRRERWRRPNSDPAILEMALSGLFLQSQASIFQLCCCELTTRGLFGNPGSRNSDASNPTAYAAWG